MKLNVYIFEWNSLRRIVKVLPSGLTMKLLVFNGGVPLADKVAKALK